MKTESQLIDQPRLFEPFFRGKNALSMPGHGLGLALVQRAGQVHKETIREASVPGPGSTVVVRLPLAY
ncbi:MAG TPA: ATP-binding protein [Hymenobacter sp.]